MKARISGSASVPALALVLAGAAALALAAQDAGEHAHDEVASESIVLELAWPETGHARMTVELEKATGAGTYACTLSWAPDPDAAEGAEPDTLVRFSDFEFLELNGRRKGDPGFEAMNNALAPALAAVPPFRVNADGDFVELLELDAALEGLKAAYEGLAPGALETLETLLQDPIRRGVIENAAAEDWSWWGSFWNGYETAPGEVVTSEISLPSGLTGNPIGGELSMECVDRHVRDGVEAIHLRARTTYDQDDMLRVTLATLRAMSGEDVPEGAIRSVGRTDEVDGVYAVDGLLPLEVRWSKTILVDDGVEARESIERKRWTFAWPAADAAASAGESER